MECLTSRQPMAGKTDLLSHRVLKALWVKAHGADPWKRVHEGFLEGLCGLMLSPKWMLGAMCALGVQLLGKGRCSLAYFALS